MTNKPLIELQMVQGCKIWYCSAPQYPGVESQARKKVDSILNYFKLLREAGLEGNAEISINGMIERDEIITWMDQS